MLMFLLAFSISIPPSILQASNYLSEPNLRVSKRYIDLGGREGGRERERERERERDI